VGGAFPPRRSSPAAVSPRHHQYQQKPFAELVRAVYAEVGSYRFFTG